MPEFSAYLDDGYTEPGYIAEMPGIYPAIRFEYRPFLIEQRSKLIDETNKLEDGQKAEQLLAKRLSEQLISWDVRDSKGYDVAISPVSLLRIKPQASQRLQAIVLYGSQASDVDPRWSEQRKIDAEELGLQSALSGARPGDVAQEANAKN